MIVFAIFFLIKGLLNFGEAKMKSKGDYPHTLEETKRGLYIISVFQLIIGIVLMVLQIRDL